MTTGQLELLIEGILAGDRARIGKALTLVESRRDDHRGQARELLQRLEEHAPAKPVVRIGISGLPGAGKSTLIESLGRWLITQRQHRVAVLAVDPSSQRTGGSILGDKTRMEGLARHSEAFVRPTPSGGALGGVADRTQESMRILEAAGFDVVMVETVGVGQSEAAVSAMVDSFVVLLVPGTGDELQGIKRGILELVDLLVINKDDGETRSAAERARRDYALALHLLRGEEDGWTPRVLKISALEGEGIETLWEALCDHRATLESSGQLEVRRAGQRVRWMWRLVEEELQARLRRYSTDDPATLELERAVRAGRRLPTLAARELLDHWLEAERATPEAGTASRQD